MEQARPVKGWFSSQLEFGVSASFGPVSRDQNTEGICQNGVLRHPDEDEETNQLLLRHAVAKNKRHITEKPVALMRDIIRTRDDW
ncbi:MAG: hypothetical protein KDB23_34475, partial [Planctomycetales bacterium]|nr:hypothetical protein [Planctomycetales bacterium]